MNPKPVRALNHQPKRQPTTIHPRVLTSRPRRQPGHPASAIAVRVGPSRSDLAPAPVLLEYLLRRLASRRTLPQARHGCGR
jgi:hypothetical protein